MHFRRCAQRAHCKLPSCALYNSSFSSTRCMATAACADNTHTTTTTTAISSSSPSASAGHFTAATTSSSSSPFTHSDSTSGADSKDEASMTFHWRPRWRYAAPFRSRRLADFILIREESRTACVMAHSYQHTQHKDLRVTLLPLRHFAHPAFFHQVDLLCSQHDSVLMEGRCPMLSAPFSTFVPPRSCPERVRPPDHDDDEGWEPHEVTAFYQPFSWGVRDSARHTVIHAADQYDYEKLPWWCSLRFNLPLLGSLAREKHCLAMIYPLYANGYRSFAVPWGAMHMPIFHEMLRDNGFELVGLSSLVLVNAVDGTVSEGEYLTLRAWQRRRARREYYVWIGLTIAIFYFLYHRGLRYQPEHITIVK